MSAINNVAETSNSNNVKPLRLDSRLDQRLLRRLDRVMALGVGLGVSVVID